MLESELSVTPYDLTLNSKGELVRADIDDEIAMPSGSVWFHNHSGERKSTGSYFTKPFAVEHLLRSALGPALESHLAEVAELVDSGDEAGATGDFSSFDAQILQWAPATGRTVDHIEAAFSRFLVENPIGAVNAELFALREVANSHLGAIADRYEIDNSQILRRLIARRCIFGLDLNPVAVELARLGLWIHTFVPGLPLGFLDHNLIAGNSLTGFGTLDEIYTYLGETTLFGSLIREHLVRVARKRRWSGWPI